MATRVASSSSAYIFKVPRVVVQYTARITPKELDLNGGVPRGFFFFILYILFYEPVTAEKPKKNKRRRGGNSRRRRLRDAPRPIRRAAPRAGTRGKCIYAVAPKREIYDVVRGGWRSLYIQSRAYSGERKKRKEKKRRKRKIKISRSPIDFSALVPLIVAPSASAADGNGGSGNIRYSRGTHT